MPEPPPKLRAESRVRIRQATLSDRDALLELSRVVFGETGTDKANELSPEFWEWQFARQPSDRMGVWVAELDGQIVGQFPSNIIRVKWEGRELLVAMVIDLMVHPAHRNKSLYVRMCRVANAEMIQSGILVCVGLPNKNSYPAAIRFLKYRPVCQIPLLVRPMRWGRLLERAKVPSWVSPFLGAVAAAGHRVVTLPVLQRRGVTIREVTEFPEKMDEFWQSASGPHRIISVRDLKYLTWRYCQCPTRTYQIHLAETDGHLGGYLVRRVIEKDGLRLGAVMDVLVEPGRRDVLDSLLASAIAGFRNQTVDALVCLMQHDNLYYRALRRHGFFRVPERLNPRTFNFVCRVLSSDLPEDEFYSSQNWFITLGDYDVY